MWSVISYSCVLLTVIHGVTVVPVGTVVVVCRKDVGVECCITLLCNTHSHSGCFRWSGCCCSLSPGCRCGALCLFVV